MRRARSRRASAAHEVPRRGCSWNSLPPSWRSSLIVLDHRNRWRWPHGVMLEQRVAPIESARLPTSRVAPPEAAPRPPRRAAAAPAAPTPRRAAARPPNRHAPSRRDAPTQRRSQRPSAARQPLRRRRPPSPQPEPAKSFEERFGTRWVVWIGGARARARRHLPGAVFDRGRPDRPGRAHVPRRAARGRAGRGRRMDAAAARSRCGIASVPTAHIPSILTAAGTTVAYATVYAAYALYGFLGPARAFVLLGIVALATLAAALLHGPALAALGRVGAFVAPLLVATGAAELLGALHLSRGRDRRRLRARAHAAVALARDHGGRLRLALAVARHRR